MIRVMKVSKHCFLWVLTPVFFLGTLSSAWAEARPNPYQAIVERNPFGLKPPPPPPDPTPPGPVIPPPKVILTGIVSAFGPVRALLEITEQEPGKQAKTDKPILREGEKFGPVEVVSIDYDKSTVRIRNNGAETNLLFAEPKLTATAAPPSVPGIPPPGGVPHPGSAPTVISPANAAVNSRGGGVTIVGGGSTPSATSAPAVAPNSAFPAAAPATGAPGGTYTAPGYNNSGGLRTIPSRSLRTDNLAPQGSAGGDPAKQLLMMHLNAEAAAAAGIPHPPPPPPPGVSE
jgi:hypothetical protein